MQDIILMGDPHLGRKFRTGVPVHRIGEREQHVWKDFMSSLEVPPGTKMHVNMGDLFDKFVVSPEVLLEAARVYTQAAETNLDCHFVIIEGNHDVSRDRSKASSFDVFTQLVAGLKNIQVVRDKAVQIGEYGFVPFNAFEATKDLVLQLPDGLAAVFGHWDIQDWGGENVIPTELLSSKGIKVAFSGHDHLPRVEARHGVTINVVGSLQPYTHAEDDTNQWYRTVTLDELSDIPEADLGNLNIRVLLKEGESLPEDLDCLSMIAKRVAVNDQGEIETDTESFDSFDIGKALAAAVHEDVRDVIMEKFNAA